MKKDGDADRPGAEFEVFYREGRVDGATFYLVQHGWLTLLLDDGEHGPDSAELEFRDQGDVKSRVTIDGRVTDRLGVIAWLLLPQFHDFGAPQPHARIKHYRNSYINPCEAEFTTGPRPPS